MLSEPTEETSTKIENFTSMSRMNIYFQNEPLLHVLISLADKHLVRSQLHNKSLLNTSECSQQKHRHTQ